MITTTSSNDILELFQGAYYDQTGNRMTIGSEEYTLSSIFTYVLCIYSALINKSYENQNLDTAHGEFLDAIAARYSLTRKGFSYGNPRFEGLFVFKEREKIYEVNELELNIKGNIYRNENRFSTGSTLPTYVNVAFSADTESVQQLSKRELVDALYETELFADGYVTTNLISDIMWNDVEMDDETFRKFIKDNMYYYQRGTAASFEAFAKSTSPNILDVKCLTQQDRPDFVPGNVDIYCKPITKYYDLSSGYTDMVRGFDIAYVARLIRENNMSVLGQTVNVRPAFEVPVDVQFEFYIDSELNTSDYHYLFQLKMEAIIRYANLYETNINQTVSVFTLAEKMMHPLEGKIEDYGFPEEHALYKEFNNYKDLTVKGCLSFYPDNRLLGSHTSYYQFYLDEALFYTFDL